MGRSEHPLRPLSLQASSWAEVSPDISQSGSAAIPTLYDPVHNPRELPRPPTRRGPRNDRETHPILSLRAQRGNHQVTFNDYGFVIGNWRLGMVGG